MRHYSPLDVEDLSGLELEEQRERFRDIAALTDADEEEWQVCIRARDAWNLKISEQQKEWANKKVVGKETSQ